MTCGHSTPRASAEVAGNLTRLISTGKHIRLASKRPLLSDHVDLITSHAVLWVPVEGRSEVKKSDLLVSASACDQEPEIG